MSHPNLDLVKLKRSVAKLKSEGDLVNEILSRLNQIADVTALCKDPEFILYVCNLLENNSYSGTKKLDKKDLAIKIIIQLNPAVNNNQDIQLISNLIDFLHSNKKIRKLNELKKIGGIAFNWLKKKLN